jgi:lipopolysaccharide transport system ATP-binding protein
MSRELGNMNKERKIAIEVKGLSKEYHMTKSKEGKGTDSFFALKDISFTLYEGDVMGVIGSNGSGKTTLLKILSQITKPSTGEVRFYGSAKSILDIGSNFHPDLSGRENVAMQLKVAGVPLREFEAYYQKTLEFSEIGDFFDQPLKYYSSGMFLRLAFSVAFHLSSDILILDEVLSVGDEGFKLKCRELLKVFAENGKTILFVSHNKSEVLELSNRCLWLDKGMIKKTGDPTEVLGEYFAMHRDNYDGKKMVLDVDADTHNHKEGTEGMIHLDWTEDEAPGNEILSIRHISVISSLHQDRIYHQDSIMIKFTVQKKKKGISIGAFFFLEDMFYQPVLVGHFLNNSQNTDFSNIVKDELGLIEISCSIPAGLLSPGKYYLRPRFGMEENEWDIDSEEAFRFLGNLHFTIYPEAGYIDFIGDVSKGSVRPALDWVIKKIS